MKETVEIRSRDYWFKIVEMLQQNWALIDIDPSGSCRVYFVHDGSGVFDEMHFISEQEAQIQLKQNGFRRYDEDNKAQELIGAPKPPFYKDSHPNGPIYSSSRYWSHSTTLSKKFGETMTFGIHQDKDFVNIYHNMPFQGRDPQKAKIVILGSDANYSSKISRHQFFDYIYEYQQDGVAFWKNDQYKCHHPFLLSDYPFDKRKDGVPYHRNFSKLGLDPQKYAEHISFLELLDVPTTGNKSKDLEQFDNLLSLKHLQYIDELIKGGGQKLFFVSNGVLIDIKRIKKIKNTQNIYPYNDLFDWVQNFVVGSQNRFTAIINGNEIKEICHFSSTQIHRQLPIIKSEMDQWLGY